MKKVYLVHGSEDGTLGIYSNIKLAYAEAANYVNSGDEATVKSYDSTCKDIKASGYSEVVTYGQTYSCTITQFYLNN